MKYAVKITFNVMTKAPNIKNTIVAAFEKGMVLTNGQANALTHSTEGGRIIRYLRQKGYPISERLRPNRLRSGNIKEFFYTQETLDRIRAEKEKESTLFEN